jgi:hypothetical protein
MLKLSSLERYGLLALVIVLTLVSLAMVPFGGWFWLPAAVFGALSALGLRDLAFHPQKLSGAGAYAVSV